MNRLDLYYDVVIAGCGVAGLYTALHLPRDKRILMLSKEDLKSCDSMLAQGGICVLRDAADYAPYFEDTMKAGHYENRRESVDIMIRESRLAIDTLLRLGVRFEKNEDGRAPIPIRGSVTTRISQARRSPRSWPRRWRSCPM